ncbi:MAG: M14 metallopeptidase family protein [Myxococcota bacterium]
MLLRAPRPLVRGRRLACLAALVVGSAGLVPTAAAAPRVRYDGDVVVALAATDPNTRAALEAMGIVPWADHPGEHFLARVPSRARAALDASGFAYRVVDPDLQATLDAELATRSRHGGEPEGPVEGWEDGFHRFEEVLERLDTLAAAAPELVTIVEIGESAQGRPIRGLRIARDSELPVVLLNSCQHAREWLSVSTTLEIAGALVDSASEAEASVAAVPPDTAADIEALLDRVAFVLVPVVNPDGYVYTWDVDRLWRKNRSDDDGVDLNRNWGLAFGGPGSSDDPTSNNYRGVAAFSEPETAALRDFMLGEERLAAHFDFHTFGQLVLYPWGFGEALSPDDDEFDPLAAELAGVLSEVHGEYYEPRRAGTWYPASGNMLDWAYGALGVRSFTIELRPMDAETSAIGFMASATEIVPTGREALAGVLAVAGWAAELPTLPPGDDGDAPSIPPSGDGAGSSSTSDAGEDGPPGDASSTSSAVGTDATPSDADGGAAKPIDPPDACTCRSSRSAPAPWWALCLFAAMRPRRRLRRSAESRRR